MAIKWTSTILFLISLSLCTLLLPDHCFDLSTHEYGPSLKHALPIALFCETLQAVLSCKRGLL